MGDDAMDPRRNYEDIYLYFNPSSKKLHDHYRYIPKFVLEEYLFIEPREDETLNVYVDHFKYQNISEREQSVGAIKKIFKDINSSNVKMNVFYHTSKGIEVNRLDPEIPEKGVSQCSLYIPFEELSYYYRLTDVFLPTHRETQGMVAQEIGACGGITVLQEWMYPKLTHDQFPAMLYKHEQTIDFNFIREVLTKFNKEDLRKNTLAKCGFTNFQNQLHIILKNYLMNKIVIYKTDFTPTANILSFFSNSINKHVKGWQSDCVHIKEFLQHGIPNDVNAIGTFGILRGTGHLLKEAAINNIDRYFIDHAYFDPGYEGKCWLRISKNKHTMNYVKDISSFRWGIISSLKTIVLCLGKILNKGGFNSYYTTN